MRESLRTMVRRPSGSLPIAMSLLALALLGGAYIYVAFSVFPKAPDPPWRNAARKIPISLVEGVGGVDGLRRLWW
jgi:hypothetical protein